MLKRTVTAVCIVTFLFVMVFWVRQYTVYAADITIAIFAFFGTYEMFRSLKEAADENGNKRYSPMGIPIILTVVTIAPMSIFMGATGLILSIMAGAIASLAIMTFKHEKYGLKDLFATVYILIYPLGLMSLFFILNHSQGEVLALLLVVAIAVLEDTMAYLVGVTCKGPKLCPSISPKKTISGAIGGIIGGLMGGVLVFLLFDRFRLFDGFKNLSVFFLHENWKVALPIYLSVGLIGGILGELGDLGASAIKRKLGIKDYGRIFPGHGGFMDRIDSFVYILPVVFTMTYFVFL